MRIPPYGNGLSLCGAIGPISLSPSGLLSDLIDTAHTGPTDICFQCGDQASFVHTAKRSDRTKGCER
jgi:hypothetical protein